MNVIQLCLFVPVIVIGSSWRFAPFAKVIDGKILSLQKQSDQKPPSAVQMTVSPQAEPSPALRYRLFPGRFDRKPGNAAPFYYRALMLKAALPESVQRQYADRSQTWLNSPLEKPLQSEIEIWLRSYHAVLVQLKTAAAREYCDWDLRPQDIQGMESISFLLHEFQQIRGLARVLEVKSRLEIAQKRYDDALDTLQIGFRLAYDAGSPPLVVTQLIGMACAGVMVSQVEELMRAPGAPNVYWALATLPSPFIDLRRGLDFEATLPLRIFPFLKDADTSQKSPQQWKKTWEDALGKLRELDPGFPERFGAVVTADSLMANGIARAKASLAASGYQPKKLDAMPAGQVTAIHQGIVMKRIYHEYLKCALLPYHLAEAKFRAVEEKVNLGLSGKAEEYHEVLPIGGLLLPGIRAAFYAGARFERRLAAMRTIESIRHYAAAHKGDLPANLALLKDLPAPDNPVTGEPFEYRLEDGGSVLLAAGGPDRPEHIFNRIYKIKIRSIIEKK